MLIGGEADLVRGAIGIMVDSIVAESRGTQTAWRYGIDWFDCWDPDGRFWLIEQITKAFFTPVAPLPRAAIFEATVDAIFAEVRSLVRLEMIDPSIQKDRRSWRQSVVAAYRCQHDRNPAIDPGCDEPEAWSRVIAVVADTITGPLSYQGAESFRDASPTVCREYLINRGLPADFLERIPPLQTVDQTQLSIDRIQHIVFQS